jgi:GntR family transcriptional regulator/MocR family aminotransferase
VIYVGSFSKTLLPMLRLGFLVAPASLRSALRTAKRLTDWHGELPPQAALAHFIDDGMLARHIRRATREYGARRRLIIDTLRRDFAGLLDPVPSAAGLHVCARFTRGTPADADHAAERAHAAGVAVESLAGHYADGPGEPGLLLGFGAIPLGQISTGLGILAASLRE